MAYFFLKLFRLSEVVTSRSRAFTSTKRSLQVRSFSTSASTFSWAASYFLLSGLLLSFSSIQAQQDTLVQKTLFDSIKNNTNIPEKTICDTTIVNSKKHYRCPLKNGASLLITSYLGREYVVEEERPKLLFKQERFIVQADSSISYIYEKEYYHYKNPYTEKKSKRTWEAVYKVSNGSIAQFKERETGKKKRSTFKQEDILGTYKKHIKRLQKAANKEKK